MMVWSPMHLGALTFHDQIDRHPMLQENIFIFFFRNVHCYSVSLSHLPVSWGWLELKSVWGQSLCLALTNRRRVFLWSQGGVGVVLGRVPK